MNARATTVAALAVLALTLTACSSDDNDQADPKPAASTPAATASAEAAADAHGYDSAQDIADALADAGLKVSTPKESTDAGYIGEVGGTAYNFTVTDGDQAPGEAGINMFPNAETLAAWVPLSKQFGGVAVTGGTWAVSLPTDGAARDDSVRLAPAVAKALDGTVQQ
ncbi:hypothetical protein ACFUCH_03675 [Streptomyces olivaceus]|uniref:hypothetical protein n=1 Tax=Streptomyces olivaceus TaxID=47716 RepID=UPI0036254A74